MAQIYPTTFEKIKSKITNSRYNQTKLGHNTYARLENDTIIVKYHNSDIVILTKDTITLNSDGWQTSTTKQRLNEFCPDNWQIYQESGIWYLWQYRTRSKLIFKDFCEYNLSTQEWLNVGIPNEVEKIKKLRKSIKQYTDKFINSVFSGKHNFDTLGDCLYCQIREVKSNIPLGELSKNKDHLLSHIKEKYFVTSLLYRAIENYQVSPIAYTILHNLSTGNKENYTMFNDIAKDQIGKSLLKYLYNQFELAI